MKSETGNLAIICATRDDVLFQAQNGEVTVHVGSGPESGTLTAAWNDNERISEIIRELNFGKYRSESWQEE